MASSLDALPPEIVQKCVEFLDFDLVSGDFKRVSRATRGVARRALTRGRWKPIRYVAVHGLAFCTPARPADDRMEVDRSDIDPPPAAACAIFREAWALDPALVIRVICEWDTDRIGFGSQYHIWQGFRFMRARGYYQARFLSIVEPSADGVSRFISALEGTYLIQFESTDDRDGFGPGKWPFVPFCMLSSLAKAHDPQISHSELSPLIGIGLEAWADPKLAARFTHNYFCCNLLAYETGIKAETWSDRWEDRAKARVFMAEINRIVRQFQNHSDQESSEDDHDY